MRVIAILNQKGGTGKTTIATSMAACLTNMGNKTILIDCDYTQESATTWASLNGNKYFDVVCLQGQQLEKYLERNGGNYDYAIVDCPPRANEVTATFVRLSEVLLIPVQPSPYDVWACNDLITIINQRKTATKNIPGYPKQGVPIAAFVISRATKNTRMVGEAANALYDIGFNIIKTMTTQYDVYKRAPMTGHTIYDAPERQPAAEKQINSITEEVLELFNEYES